MSNDGLNLTDDLIDGLAKCPIECDADCDQPCHEVHQVFWKRLHAPEDCPSLGALRASGARKEKE